MHRAVAALAGDGRVDGAPHRIDGRLRGERGGVVERRHQDFRHRLLPGEAAQEALGPGRIAEAVEPRLRRPRQFLAERGGDALGALGCPYRRVAEIAEDDRDNAPVGPGIEGEFGQRLAGDASGEPVVGGVEGGAGDRVVDRQHRDAGAPHQFADLGIGRLVGAVLGVEVEPLAHRLGGVGQRLLAVAVVVEKHQFDRLSARRIDPARPDLGAAEPQAFEPLGGVQGRVGDADPPAPRGLRPCGTAPSRHARERSAQCRA
jgi:hypothetical protein